MDNMENKNENVQDQQNAPVDGEYSFFYGHKPEDEQSNSQQTPKAEPFSAARAAALPSTRASARPRS